MGLPGAGERQRESTVRLCRDIAEHRMKIKAGSAARTMVCDIEPIVDAVQATGVPIIAFVFWTVNGSHRRAKQCGNLRRRASDTRSHSLRITTCYNLVVVEKTMRLWPILFDQVSIVCHSRSVK